MLKHLVLNVTEDEFQRAVEDERLVNRESMCGDFPDEYAMGLLWSIICPGHLAAHEKLHLLESIQFAEFQKFCQQFFARMKIRALIQGNFTVDEAKSIVQMVETNLGCEKVDKVSRAELSNAAIQGELLNMTV